MIRRQDPIATALAHFLAPIAFFNSNPSEEMLFGVIRGIAETTASRPVRRRGVLYYTSRDQKRREPFANARMPEKSKHEMVLALRMSEVYMNGCKICGKRNCL
jgi:hypothetical protein